MSEQAVVFGDHQHLVGTVTHPIQVRQDVAVLMLTPGMLHHAGPFRLHREFACALAERQLRSFRFDLSGIGESLAIGASGRSIDRAAAEARQAMDWVQHQFGIEKFILFGLCSGADDSVQAALFDERVVGLAVMDGCGYPTFRFSINRLLLHYGVRVMSLQKWQRLFRRLCSTVEDDAPSSLQIGNDLREFPSREEAMREFQTLVNRGLRMHFCYTGGVADYYNYAEQFFDMFRGVSWNRRATTRYFAHMDHVARLSEDRSQLVSHLVNEILWIAEPHRGGAGSSQPIVGFPVQNSLSMPIPGSI